MNSLTHGLGAVLPTVGLVVLAVAAARHGTARAVVGCVVFGTTLVFLYASSTRYHSVGPERPRGKAVLRVLDHSAIFLLLAGTYTPFCLLVPPETGRPLLWVVWSGAGAGMLLSVPPLVPHWQRCPRPKTARILALSVHGWRISNRPQTL